ncbi:hypothetical protein GZH49_35240 [Nocardia terpenica]|uniref:hypothetical protein n=1 Tax=Nocardia terpenica TaxID=455432 RepID=UPI0026B935ED
MAAHEKSVLANLILMGDDLKVSRDALTADVKGKVIDALMTVMILLVRNRLNPKTSQPRG